MVRQGHFIAVVVTFLIAALVFGCGAGGTGNNDGRGPGGLDAKVVSPPGQQANRLAGFGEGSLWAMGQAFSASASASTSASAYSETPDPSASASPSSEVPGPAALSASASASAISGAGGGPVAPQPLLLRLDPQTGEEVATISLKDLNDAFPTQVAFGAGSVWVSSGYYGQPGGVVFRIDPRTNRVVDRIPVNPPSGLAFGHGSVWATSAGYGTVSRIDPQSEKVVAKIKVGRGAMGIAADERSGAVWIASTHLPKTRGGDDNPKYFKDNNLTRVDPTTNRVVEEIPIEAHSRYGGGAQNVAVGEGAVWVLSGGDLLKVDPATNKIAARVSVVGDPGAEPSHLAVYGDGVWAMVEGREYRLVLVDPQTMHIVASKDIGYVGALAAGGGYVWFSSKEGLARVSP